MKIDTDYYFPSFVNPNTNNEMYWKDSINVLQDLGQFESLHIKYHHCVWSKYGSRYGSGEDYDARKSVVRENSVSDHWSSRPHYENSRAN